MVVISTVFNDVNFQINKDGGYLAIDDFNGLSKRAELKLLDFITGDVGGQTPPIPSLTQKNSDWLSKFIVPHRRSVVGGFIDKPEDCYGFDEMYRINGIKKDVNEEEVYIPNTPIELLSSSKFSYRGVTFIEELKPSAKKPIARLLGNSFEFLPRDIGSVHLSYIRYPKYGVLAKKIDDVYNDEVPDEENSTAYEWDEWAREALIYYIVDGFANRTREQALKQGNIISHQTVK